MFSKSLTITLLILLLLSACTATTPANTPAEPSELRVMTHDSFSVSEEVVAAFEQANHARVRFLESGDAGTALNKAILSKATPLADVFYGVDNTFLSRALNEGIFIPYASPLLEDIPAKFQLDPSNRALPVDFGDVCLNYDKQFFKELGLTPPQSLDDLLDPAYKDLLAVENPATSSPGLAFMLATIGQYGPDGYLGYWQDLLTNGVKIVNNWESAYYTEFSAHGGTRPLVVSYGSSPPAEVIFAETSIDEPPTGVISGNDSCFRQVEFVGILSGSQNQELAQKWVDFMLSPTFQEDMPLQMFVFPVNQEAKLPAEFEQFTVIPETTAEVDPEEINKNRENWIRTWSETILR